MTDEIPSSDGAPLGGIIVVSVEQAVSAPFATRQLADLGATVIKVEPPAGDFARRYDAVMRGQSANFVWANMGKQSVVLDLRDPEDHRMLMALIAGADVFVHNMAPDSARRAGIDVAELTRIHPFLIACEISGYGAGGPRSDDKAYDLAIQAEAGAFSVTGDEEMSKVGFAAADISAGMYALTSVLAALVRRERTGEGAAIRVSMLDSLAEWMSAPLYGAVYGGGQPPRTGRRHHAIAPYGTFRLADGSTILVAVQSDREWRVMASDILRDPRVADDERFATNPGRLDHVAELEDVVSRALSSVPVDEVLEGLSRARIAWSRVNDLEGVWNHEQLRSRGRFGHAQTETGDVEVLDPVFDISGWSTPARHVPALGEHERGVIDAVIDRGERG